jgi:hypothetical protein
MYCIVYIIAREDRGCYIFLEQDCEVYKAYLNFFDFFEIKFYSKNILVVDRRYLQSVK